MVLTVAWFSERDRHCDRTSFIYPPGISGNGTVIQSEKEASLSIATMGIWPIITREHATINLSRAIK